MICNVRQFILGIIIFIGIVWFGVVVLIDWCVFLASHKLILTVHRIFLSHLMTWVHWPLTLVGGSVITTGIVLGTVSGPLKSWEAVMTTSYGRLFLTALIIAILTLLWGMFVGYRHAMGVFNQVEIWKNAEQGDVKPLKKALISIAALESIEIAGFIAILICMVLI